MDPFASSTGMVMGNLLPARMSSPSWTNISPGAESITAGPTCIACTSASIFGHFAI
jgi:hypothetical protein